MDLGSQPREPMAMPPPSERDARASNRQVLDYRPPMADANLEARFPLGSTSNVAGRNITVIPKRRGYQGGQIPNSQAGSRKGQLEMPVKPR